MIFGNILSLCVLFQVQQNANPPAVKWPFNCSDCSKIALLDGEDANWRIRLSFWTENFNFRPI